jgi:hypothetical protein
MAMAVGVGPDVVGRNGVQHLAPSTESGNSRQLRACPVPPDSSHCRSGGRCRAVASALPIQQLTTYQDYKSSDADNDQGQAEDY